MQQGPDRVDELITAWRATFPDAVDEITELAKRVMVLADELHAATRRELPEFGLTGAEFGVLTALRRSEPPYRMKPRELTSALLLSSGGTSNVVNHLAAKGLVAREADPGDGRSTLIRLTERGVTVAEDALRANAAAHAELLDGVPAEAIADATRALRGLSAARRAKDRRRR